MKIFAYGSNMNLKRLQKRVPSATKVSNASLDGYAFKFNKTSNDGSGKGNIEQTNNPADKVWGVIFEIDDQEKAKLDEAEGLGNGYNETLIDVTATNGQKVSTQVYLGDAGVINNALNPFDWYKAYVVSGAKDNELPGDYTAGLEAALSTVDSDTKRRDKHFKVINGE
ncbi:MAG: gamma-glutamylcyclotransferase family protein [Ferruginibacter sp.]